MFKIPAATTIAAMMPTTNVVTSAMPSIAGAFLLVPVRQAAAALDPLLRTLVAVELMLVAVGLVL